MRSQIRRLFTGLVVASIFTWTHAAAAWNWSDPQRGWVDAVVWHTYVGPNPGPLLPGMGSGLEVDLQGWACLSPAASIWYGYYPWLGSSTSVSVYQGGPPGVGTQLPIVFAAKLDLPAVVAYGACVNLDNGFSVIVIGNPNLAPVFYVSFWGGFSPITLEGTSSATFTP